MITIPAFHHIEPKSHNVTFPPPLAADLELYRQFYRSTYGTEVKEPDLIREIVRCFLEQEEGFRTFKRQAKPSGRQRRSTSGKPAPAEPSATDTSPAAKRTG